eukprot:scaffold19665_cov53-Prasinocladus_malaysianus.AAC.1
MNRVASALDAYVLPKAAAAAGAPTEYSYPYLKYLTHTSELLAVVDSDSDSQLYQYGVLVRGLECYGFSEGHSLET